MNARAKAIRLAILGIGSMYDDASSFLRAGLRSRTDLSNLRDQGIVGNICSLFYDHNGNFYRFDINHRIIGIELNDLRNIPLSIGIARGISKVPAILGASQGKFVKVLVTDDVAAQAVIEWWWLQSK
ncbi:MAG: sugar-binding domain-containing protein [Anaerolineae bacterium]